MAKEVKPKKDLGVKGVSKRCPSCQTVKPYEAFYKSSHTKSGIQTYCKPCQNDIDKAKRELRKQYGPTVQRTQKICPRCQSMKPISQFAVKRDASDGRTSYCKTCWTLYVKLAKIRASKKS